MSALVQGNAWVCGVVLYGDPVQQEGGNGGGGSGVERVKEVEGGCGGE